MTNKPNGKIRHRGEDLEWDNRSERNAAMLRLGSELLGCMPNLDDIGKVRRLVNKPRIPEGTPRGCVTPSGMRDAHGVVAIIKPDGEIVCAFCEKSYVRNRNR